MIAILHLNDAAERARVEELLGKLRLDPRELSSGAGGRGKMVEDVQKILEDVAQRGDAAVVDSCRKFDDPDFTAAQIRVTQDEMRQASQRVSPEVREALRRSI